MQLSASRQSAITITIAITTLLTIGAVNFVFAQDEAEENITDDVNTVTVIEEISDVNTEDNVAVPKKSKSGKKSKAEKSASVSIAETETAKEVSRSTSTALKISGLVAAGVDVNSKENKRAAGKKADAMAIKRVARGELEISAQPVKKVRAEIGIEYNANGRVMVADSLRYSKTITTIDPMAGTSALTDVDIELLKGLPLGPFVTIDKLYAQYNIVDNGSIRAGIMKKSFGLEERAGLDERYFLKRSIINDGLEALGFLDHDLTASYRHDLLDDRLRLTGAFSWSAVDSLAYLQNYSAYYRPGSGMEFILAGIVRYNSDTANGNPSTVFAASLSFRHVAAVCVSEAELTVGTNPQIWMAPHYRKTMLAGARIQEQFPIDIDSKILRRIAPVAEAAIYAADLDSGYTDTQIRAGVTLGFAKNSAFQFRNNFGTIIRTPQGKNAKSEVRRYRFDSEAIVIF